MAKQQELPGQLLKEKLLQDPNDIKTRFQLAKLFFEEKNLKLALMHTNIILKDKPSHKNAQILKIAIKEAQAPMQRKEQIEKPISDQGATDDEPSILDSGPAADDEPNIMGDNPNDEWEILDMV